MEKIVINGTLPSLNTIINEAKKHPMAYASMKNESTQTCQWPMKELPPDFTPDKVFLDITYFVPNWRTDPDNVAAAKKFIMDALVEEEIIEDDTHKFIAGWEESFKKDKENPRIEIEIEKVE